MKPHISNYWGKARPSLALSAQWHPLAYHGLDVAASGHALLAARPQLLTALANAAGQPEPLVRSWLLLALALHDIGKYADCFQCKAVEQWHHQGLWQGKHLAADLGHGGHGAGLWRDKTFIGLGIWGTNPRDILHNHGAFTHWLDAIFGHHGRPVEPQSLGSDRICAPARADALAYAQACALLFSSGFPPGGKRLEEMRFKIE